MRHDVEVLTTAARDPRTWKNEYVEGADRVGGVLVRRFTVNQPRDANAFRQFSDSILDAPRSRAEEMEWVRRLGPSVPGLVEHLKRQNRSYDAIVFFSLVHWTTVHGLAVAPERSILFPCLRLGPVLRFGLWPDLLASARAIGLVSGHERTLLRSYLGLNAAREELVGGGIDPSHRQAYPRHQQDPAGEPAADDPIALSVLESFAVGTPVLASARNDAAVEHCRRAGGGLYYGSRGEFVDALRMLMTRSKLREQLGEGGRQYVRQYFRWEAVLGRFERLVTLVRGRG